MTNTTNTKPTPVRRRRSVADAYRRAGRYPSRDVIFTADGGIYWPLPGECALPGEVWVRGGELGFFSPADIARMLDEKRA